MARAILGGALGLVGALGWTAPTIAAPSVFVSDGVNLVSVLNTASNSLSARVPVGAGAAGVAVHPSGTRVYVANFNVNTLSVIDTAGNSVIATIPVGAGPLSVAVNPAGTAVYVTNSNSGSLSVISTATNTVTTTVSMGVGASPQSVRVHPAGTFVYVANLTSGASGNVTVIDAATNAALTAVPVPNSPLALAIHPSGDRVYAATLTGGISTPSSGLVSVISTLSNTVTTTVTLPALAPSGMAVHPDGSVLYVTGDAPSTCFPGPCPAPPAGGVAFIDTAANMLVATVPVGAGPGLAVHPTGSAVYVTDRAGRVSVINPATRTVTASALVGSVDLAIGPEPPSVPGSFLTFSIRSSNGAPTAVGWGGPGDLPVHADYDGDHRADVAVWRPREGAEQGLWYILRSLDGGVGRVPWGTPELGDIPVPADYDGDGKADIAVFRPREGSVDGVWWIIRSSDGGVVRAVTGQRGDLPVPADYDGDGKADIAVWRPATGRWHITLSSNAQVVERPFGLSTDIPVPGDYDGDGKADIAVWRASTGEWWVLFSSSGGIASTVWGAGGDVPVPRDYDGDGRTDIAVFRPSTGNWFIINSTNGGVTQQPFGTRGDLPVPRDYDGDRRADISVYRP